MYTDKQRSIRLKELGEMGKVTDCFEAYNGSDGNDGDCCCNCRWQTQINKHPWNKIAKGNISEQFAWVCMNTFEDDSGTPFVMEKQHSMCELHWRKQDGVTYQFVSIEQEKENG